MNPRHALAVLLVLGASSCALGTHTRAEVAEIATQCTQRHMTVAGKKVRAKHVQIQGSNSRDWLPLCAFPDQNLTADTYELRKRNKVLHDVLVGASVPVAYLALGYGIIFAVFAGSGGFTG